MALSSAAGPAMGKTCLMSQLVTHVLRDEKAALVPILIKVQVRLSIRIRQRRTRCESVHHSLCSA